VPGVGLLVALGWAGLACDAMKTYALRCLASRALLVCSVSLLSVSPHAHPLRGFSSRGLARPINRLRDFNPFWNPPELFHVQTIVNSVRHVTIESTAFHFL
jgi:hypothetical protein